MTSRRDANLTQNNNTTHIHTDFLKLNSEQTQKEVLKAIQNINISAEISGITVESSDTITHEKLDTLNSNLVNKHLDSTTDSVTVNVIDGFATEETLQAMKVKTDDLTFSDNDGVIELRVFDSQNNTGLNTINDTITNKHLDSTTDSVTVNVISGFALESGGNLAAIKSNTDKLTSDPVLTDAIQVAVKNTVDVSGSVNIDNFPTSTEVSNFPTSTEVSNFPTSTEISNLSEVPLITGFATETKQDTQIEELEKVVDKKGDIEAVIYHNQGSQVWADSVPEPVQYEKNPYGWAYENASAGNAMNLYYFNGNNGETKTLNQVVGQYAVVSNLSTKVNNSLIFAIYTKSDTSFFTTRITHSPASGVNLTAGGKFLCYWGSLPQDIYPNLPRLNFTDITTTGPAIPTEQILSVSLNTNSETPAGDVVIFVESLGVVFNNSGVNQSRVLELLSDRTFYALTNDTAQFGLLINAYLNNLQKTNGALNTYITNDNFTPVPVSFSGGIDINNQITNYALEADGNLEEIRNKTDNFNFNDNSGVLELNVFDVQNNAKLDAIETYTSKLNDLTYTDNNLNVNIAAGSITLDTVKIQASNGDNLTATGSSLNANITNTITTNSRTEDGSGNDITSTDLLNSKRGLDTASSLFGYAGSARTALTCDIGGKLMVSSYTSDDLGNGVTSSATSTSVRSLDTASSLYVSNGTARTALTASGSSLNTNITNTVPISGSISNSFTLDTTTQSSNTKLDTIHTDLDGLTFDGSSNLNVNVNAGSITVDSVKIKASNGDNLTATGTSLNTNITNSSIDSHIYGKTQGGGSGTWKEVLLTPQGELITQSQTQDGAGNNITSTLNGAKQSLDVNVSNTPTVNISENQSVKIYDGTDTLEVNSIPSSITNTKGLNTQSLLFLSTQNSTLEWGTSTVSTNFNAIDTNLTAFNRTNSDYQRLTSVQPIGSANTRALETYAYNVGLNNASNIPLPITSTTTDTTQSMDCVINNGNTTNEFSKTGISMYPLYPKKRVYSTTARQNSALANSVLGATGSSRTISNTASFPYFVIGSGQPHYIYLTASTGAGRIIYLEYISSINGTIKQYAISLSLNTWQELTPPDADIACIRVARGLSLMFQDSNENIRISTTNTNANAYFYWDKFRQENGVYICPRNCVAYISNIAFHSPNATDILLYKTSNVAFPPNSATLKYEVATQYYNASGFVDTAGYDGAIGGTISAGQGIFWMTTSGTPIDKRISFSINEYFDL